MSFSSHPSILHREDDSSSRSKSKTIEQALGNSKNSALALACISKKSFRDFNKRREITPWKAKQNKKRKELWISCPQKPEFEEMCREYQA